MIRLSPIIAATLALTACTQERQRPEPALPPAPPTGGSCDASKVQDVVGKPRSDALLEDARTRSGAKVVRFLTPDMMVTMEYSGDRLNLHVGTDSKIGSARCG